MKPFTLITSLTSVFILAIFLIILDNNIVNAVINVGDPDPSKISPYTKLEGAPQILIKNDINTYQGELRVFNLISGDVNNIMPSVDSNDPILSTLPADTITISQNEKIQLLITGNPQPELQPNSLLSTVYFNYGTAFKILTLAENAKKDSFVVDVPKGKYFLLATATWLPNPDDYLTTSGYVRYPFRLYIQ